MTVRKPDVIKSLADVKDWAGLTLATVDVDGER
jgi:hypothetical protein